ncbi:MAG: sugar phosphate nucleotidyltransferase [Patescibacteria group bacterium]
MKAVILAGGSGTRLWPMSRQSRPKQFFNVVTNEPLIRDTYRRLLRLFPHEKIYFSISPEIQELLKNEFPELEDYQIIIEPEKRDTGPAMGYVAAKLEMIDPDEPIVFVPADHYIGDEEKFLQCISVGDRLIRETGKLLDIAIEPSFPSTVLGYTKISDLYKKIDGIDVFNFAGHSEKPDYNTAKSYLESGQYLWHANYYMWTPAKFVQAFEKYAPKMGAVLRAIQAGEGDYRDLQKISFDYAVTEKMDPKDVLIIKGDFAWSDIGAWDTLHERLSDNETNVTKGMCVALDTKGSLIYGPADKLIAVVGMENIVVVDSGDSLLICKKQDAQRVKELITLLQEQGYDQFL